MALVSLLIQRNAVSIHPKEQGCVSPKFESPAFASRQNFAGAVEGVSVCLRHERKCILPASGLAPKGQAISLHALLRHATTMCAECDSSHLTILGNLLRARKFPADSRLAFGVRHAEASLQTQRDIRNGRACDLCHRSHVDVDLPRLLRLQRRLQSVFVLRAEVWAISSHYPHRHRTPLNAPRRMRPSAAMD